MRNITTTLIQRANEQHRQTTRNSLNSPPSFPSETINTERWLSNYQLETNNLIPIATQVQNVEVLDSGGIINLNQNQNVVNRFVETIQNNENQIIINPDNNNLTSSVIENSQQLLNNNPNLNGPIMSIFLNHPDLNQLLIELRDNIHNFHQSENYSELIRPFMNSFMIFLSTHAGTNILDLQQFYEALEEILLSLNTLNVNQENVEIVENTNHQIRINLDQHILRLETLLENLQRREEENFQEILNSSSVRRETEILRNISQNTEIINNAIEKLEEIEEESQNNLEEKKKEILEKLQKLIFNKKLVMVILSALIASQTGLMLPLSSVFRILNTSSNLFETNSNINSDTSSLIQNNDIRLRDVYDVFLQKLFQHLNNL